MNSLKVTKHRKAFYQKSNLFCFGHYEDSFLTFTLITPDQTGTSRQNLSFAFGCYVIKSHLHQGRVLLNHTVNR